MGISAINSLSLRSASWRRQPRKVQSGLVCSPCKVRDCFVPEERSGRAVPPRNDKSNMSLRAIAWQPRTLQSGLVCSPGKVRGCFVPRNDRWGISGLLLRVITAGIILLSSITQSYAQSFDNNVYRPEIRSVEFYNTSKQASFPIINLGSSERVLLSFDDLQGGTKTIYYSIEHCDAEWNSSNLSPAEYLQSYTEDRLLDYSYSTNTIQKYTHYEVKLPNENIAPKIAGNYVLKVYEDGDQSKLILTRRFYVLGAKASLFAEIVPSNNVAARQSNQKINFTISTNNLSVQNPSANIRTVIMQNARTETAQLNVQPTYIRGTQLVYSDVTMNDFPGGNEFRHFDTRTLKLNSEHIARIFRDTANIVVLLTDPNRDQPNYTFQYDLNGNYYVINQDGIDPRRDADYARTYFSLAANRQAIDGNVYIAGRFNDYKLDERSKMTNDANGKFYINLLLKQGVYDYQYVWVDKAGKADYTALEGSHFETENDYQVLVYYRPPGARWEELVGYQVLNTVKK
ncbi:DUF5103 domain-containing protein [soil metagenome]